MSVKRILCLVLSVLLFVNFALTLCVSAAGNSGISLLWNCIDSEEFTLTVYNGTAYIRTRIYASEKITLYANIQLYRQSGNSWVAVGDPIYHNISNGYLLDVTDTVSNLSSGNYKAVLTATAMTSTAKDQLSIEAYS